MRRNVFLALCLGAVVLSGAFAGSAAAREKMTLASTTSTLDSGFFDAIIPVFEKKFNCSVRVIAVGTGQAIRLARDGNADALLVHDREAEDKFVADGFGVKRLDVMHNDFVIVGPRTDPAAVHGLRATEAFRKIAAVGVIFVSRGDDSGTHKKELRLWKILGSKPVPKSYLESGSGMEATLRVADEKNGYTLVDRATWLAHKKEIGTLDLLVEGDPELFNPYSVIVVSPARFPWVNFRMASKFAGFLRGPDGQKLIREFGVEKYGRPLFFPDVIQ